MRAVLFGMACLAVTTSFGQSIAGIWKPGLEHGKVTGASAQKLASAKERLRASSLKLNKDKTFGCLLVDRIMKGKWTYDGKVLTLHIKEVIGMTEKQFKALPEQERVARLQRRGLKFVTAPVKAGGTNMVWKKVG